MLKDFKSLEKIQILAIWDKICFKNRCKSLSYAVKLIRQKPT